LAVTTVQNLLSKASTVIQDRTNIRWQEDELIGWLNEAYQQIVLLRPDANAQTKELPLINGSKQQIPDDGVALLTVVRNQNGTAMHYRTFCL